MKSSPSAFRFRLYPSSELEAKMLKVLEACRGLWNDALSHRIWRWLNERRSTSYNLQQWILTAERHSNPELAMVYSQVAQDVLHRIDRAFQNFFNGNATRPKFKKFAESGSFTYPQAYNGSAIPDKSKRQLYLSSIGNIKTVFHRPFPQDSRIKTCTIVREPDGKWFASLIFEEVVPLQNMPFVVVSKAPIGIDLGLRSLIATSEGDKVEHPHFMKKTEKRLKLIQRDFSRKEKASSNWFKARQRVASQHARVRRQRLDFNQKLSTQLTKKHGIIAFENLRIRNMLRNHSLAKSIQDAGWGQLIALTEYKATRGGNLMVRVEPSYSTQECFYCGFRNPVDLATRNFRCRRCAKDLDRDVNAAKVVLKRAIAKVGHDMPELTPVEAAPVLRQPTGRARAAAESGTKRPGIRAGKPRVWAREDVTTCMSRRRQSSGSRRSGQ